MTNKSNKNQLTMSSHPPGFGRDKSMNLHSLDHTLIGALNIIIVLLFPGFQIEIWTFRSPRH